MMKMEKKTNENTAEPWRICGLDFFFRHSLSMKSGLSFHRNTFNWTFKTCTHEKKKKKENWKLMLDIFDMMCAAFSPQIHRLCFKEIYSAKWLLKREVRISFSHHIRSYKSTTRHHNTFIIISNNTKNIKEKTHINNESE